MFIIRYPYSHQYKPVIVIVYWSEYPDEVIRTLALFTIKATPISEEVNGKLSITGCCFSRTPYSYKVVVDNKLCI